MFQILVFCHLLIVISGSLATKTPEIYLPQNILLRGELITRDSFTPLSQNESTWSSNEQCSGEPEDGQDIKNAIIGERYRWYKSDDGLYAIPVYINPDYGSIFFKFDYKI
jgi:hypothetical protein